MSHTEPHNTNAVVFWFAEDVDRVNVPQDLQILVNNLQPTPNRVYFCQSGYVKDTLVKNKLPVIPYGITKLPQLVMDKFTGTAAFIVLIWNRDCATGRFIVNQLEGLLQMYPDRINPNDIHVFEQFVEPNT